MTTRLHASLQRFCDPLGSGPLLVHSDVLEVRKLAPLSRDRALVLDAHVRVLATLAGGRDLWFPAFNYDFTRSGRFDLAASPSQVGVLSERFRTAHATWRSAVPVFSVTGTGAAPAREEAFRLDPFGADSVFAQLRERDGSVLFYGASTTSGTFLHHVERLAGGPPYRYDKYFPGTIVLPDGNERRVELEYHVRPLNHHLDYDWPRLARDLRSDGLLLAHEQPGARLYAFRCRAVATRWRERLARDPLYLLDDVSRGWIAPMLDRLGRRFALADFEPVAERGEQLATS